MSRTSFSGHSFSKKSRAKFFSSSCCSSSPRSIGAFLLLGRSSSSRLSQLLPTNSQPLPPRHPEAALGDDSFLYLRGAAANRQARLPQILPLEPALQRYPLRTVLQLSV